MNVQHRVELATELPGLAHSLVRHGERGVQSHHPADVGALIFPHESTTFGQAPASLVTTAIALGGTVAEHRPYAELVAGVSQDIE